MTEKTNHRTVRLRIVLEQPPPGIAFGIQKGKGSAWETIQKQVSQKKDLRFELDVEVRPAGNYFSPDFAGPVVQGPKAERFIYVGIGTFAGDVNSRWTRRLKVPLSGITAKMTEGAGVLEARLPATGRDGSPSCGTIRAENFSGGGWQLT